MADAAHPQDRSSRSGLWLAAALIALAALLGALNGLGRVDQILYDRAVVMTPRPASPDILIVAIDDAAIATALGLALAPRHPCRPARPPAGRGRRPGRNLRGTRHDQPERRRDSRRQPARNGRAVLPVVLDRLDHPGSMPAIRRWPRPAGLGHQPDGGILIPIPVRRPIPAPCPICPCCAATCRRTRFAEPDTINPNDDAILADSLRRNGRAVLPVVLDRLDHPGSMSLPIPALAQAAAGLGHQRAHRRRRRGARKRAARALRRRLVAPSGPDAAAHRRRIRRRRPPAQARATGRRHPDPLFRSAGPYPHRVLSVRAARRPAGGRATRQVCAGRRLGHRPERHLSDAGVP